ncbi:34028_t:CDS:2, partial [Racocetra persica]
NQICLNKGVIIDSDGMLYENGECTDVRLPSILIDSFGGMLCLPDGVFFLGKKGNGSKLLIRTCYLQLCELIESNRKNDGPASIGCTITGTPVLQCNETIFYQFLPDGNVQRGDSLQFYETLNNPNNFLLVDAQALTFQYNAYMILLTSPKVERFNEAVKWPGFTQYFMP